MEVLLPVTGVGSLPFGEIEEGVSFVETHCSSFPFVPQFPQKGRFFEMTLEPFAACSDFIETTGRPTIKKGQIEEMLESLRQWEVVRPVTEAVCRRDWKAAQVKSEIVGPYTLGSQIFYAGNSLLENELGRRLILERLAAIVSAEFEVLRTRFKEVTFVLDEPSLAFLKKKDVLIATKIAKELRARVARAGLSIGIHSCAPLPGLPSAALLKEVGYEVLSLAFEPFRPFEETVSLEYLPSFLSSGGKIIWGFLPTNETKQLSLPELAAHLLSEFKRLGIPKETLLRSSALSPACGLALLEPRRSDEIFRRLSELRQLLLEGFTTLS